MNVLDENILESQRQFLQSWGIPVRQIEQGFARKGMKDEAIIPFLLTLRSPTLFTRDLGLYDRGLLHARYCLVILAVGQYEAAHFVRRVLRYPNFDTQAKRMGTLIRAMHTGLAAWRLDDRHEIRLSWSD